MISNLKTFENKNFGKLTVIEKDGEFFFIANEVATMLGYVNPRKAVYDHVDEEDKGVTKWNTLIFFVYMVINSFSGIDISQHRCYFICYKEKLTIFFNNSEFPKILIFKCF